MEYTKPTLMLVGEVGAVVLGSGPGALEDGGGSQTTPPFSILGLDD